jgi:hypothetical protein
MPIDIQEQEWGNKKGTPINEASTNHQRVDQRAPGDARVARIVPVRVSLPAGNLVV